MTDTLFEVHKLNEDGLKKAALIADTFNHCLNTLSEFCLIDGISGREWSIVKTKLEEAAFFAKKAMAIQTRNQESR